MQAVSELAQKHLVAVADARKSEVETWLKERINSLETLALMPLPADKTSVARMLGSFQGNNPSFKEIALYDAEWNLVAAANDPADGETIVPEVRAGVEQTLKTFFTARQDSSGNTELRLACPVKAATGQVSGFLAANLDFGASLTKMLQDREGLYKSGKVFLATHDGNVLTQPLPGEQMAAWKRRDASVPGHHMADPAPPVTSDRKSVV